MKIKLLLMLALAIVMADMSSCTMRHVSGTPYKIWSPSGRTSKHYGARKRNTTKRMFWSRDRYGKRPYDHRGRWR